MDKKKILVTAGPVWVPIDSVRVLTNRFSGRTGAAIANGLAREGHEVTLLLGPTTVNVDVDDSVCLERFVYFDELRDLVEENLSVTSMDAVVHTAAIADYQPQEFYEGKIKSKQEELLIRLKPTVKIIKDIREFMPEGNLIQFKLEVGLSQSDLVDVAYSSLKNNSSDYVVANDLSDMRDGCYRGTLIDSQKNCSPIFSRNNLVKKIVEII